VVREGVVTNAQELEGTLAIMATEGRRRLTFEEVLASGQPAVYRRFGDHLLYVNGRFFDVHEPGAPVEVGLSARPEEPRPQIERHAVGIEYGWRHSADCPCSYCSESREAA